MDFLGPFSALASVSLLGTGYREGVKWEKEVVLNFFPHVVMY